ncbi:MAG: HAD hydrolase family protein [Deltaproteobacteria bacterium]|nr:HAD hydrolase family protein [Deltaproteobacteria bacterium]
MISNATDRCRPIEAIPDSELRAIKAVFFDIDDTFSGGEGQSRILPQAYEALWRLKRAGYVVVPVTGRPAGWCDFITRMWPVTGVVGENGAFFSYLDTSKKPQKLSIHVNAWFGKYDKLACVRRILSTFFRIDFPNIVYIGDSPNDEPFFERLPITVGVANVYGFLGRMKHHPAYVTRGDGGQGFAEFAERLLGVRK